MSSFQFLKEFFKKSFCKIFPLPKDAGVDLDMGELDEALEPPEQVQHGQLWGKIVEKNIRGVINYCFLHPALCGKNISTANYGGKYQISTGENDRVKISTWLDNSWETLIQEESFEINVWIPLCTLKLFAINNMILWPTSEKGSLSEFFSRYLYKHGNLHFSSFDR